MKSLPKKYIWYALLAAIFFYIVFFSAMNLYKYQNFGYDGMDLGIIHQVFFNSANGQWFSSSIHSPSYLGDHFSPMLIILLPFYMLFKHPITLLILQNIALALCAIPLFLIAKKYFTPLTSLGIAFAWLLNPVVENMSMYEFSFMAFTLPFIFFAIVFYKNNSFFPFLLMASMALLAREDVAIFIFMFGIIALIEKREKKWIIIPCFLALIYFIFAIKFIGWIKPDGGYKFSVYYSWLGTTPLEIFSNIIFHPLAAIKRFFYMENIEMVLGLLMPFSFLPVIAPKYLLFALLSFAQIFFLYTPPGAIVLKTHYGALFLPALFLSYIFALKKLKEIKENPMPASQPKKQRILHKTQLTSIFVKEPLGILIVCTASIYSFFSLGPAAGTLAKDMLYKDSYQTSMKQSFLNDIPPNASIVSSYEFLAPLSPRTQLYSMNYFYIGQEQLSEIPYVLAKNTEFLLMNSNDFLSYELQYKNHSVYGDNYFSGDNRIRDRIEKDRFGVIKIFDDIALLKKDSPSTVTLYNIYDSKPKISYPGEQSLGNAITFLGYDTMDGYSMEKDFSRIIPLSLFWRADNDIQDNYHINLIVKKSGKERYQKFYPLAFGIYPTSEWIAGQIIRTNYWFYMPEVIASGEYDLFLELAKIIDGARFFDSDLSTKGFITKKEVLGEPVDIGKININ